MNKFIKDHIVQIHFQYLSKQHRTYLPPLDRFLRSYFTKHKSIGSSERSTISEKIFSMIRYEHLLSYMTKTTAFKVNDERPTQHGVNSQHGQDIAIEQKPTRRQQQLIQDKLQLLSKNEIYSIIDNQKMPKYLSIPYNNQMAQKFIQQIYGRMFQHVSNSLMEEGDFIGDRTAIHEGKSVYQLGNQQQAFKIMQIMNTRAPLTLRVNPLKVNQYKFEKTIAQMEKQFKVRLHKTEFAPYGYKIIAPKNVNLLETESFLNGEFEIQDEGSQLTTVNVKCKPGDLVLDFCGGSGGKSLAIAHKLQNKGQIFVHEPRQVALEKAKKRFKRAGVQNVQFHSNEDSLQKVLLKKADWIIIDAPCTGVGTLRRNPDIKLRFTEDYLKKNTILQEQIFARTLKYLSKNGRILYITCSLLKQENEDQINKFTSLHGLEVQNKQIMKILPQKDGMDGFFATVLKRK